MKPVLSYLYLIIGFYTLIATLLFVFQRSFLYLPDKTTPDAAAAPSQAAMKATSPAAAVAPARQIWDHKKLRKRRRRGSGGTCFDGGGYAVAGGGDAAAYDGRRRLRARQQLPSGQRRQRRLGSHDVDAAARRLVYPPLAVVKVAIHVAAIRRLEPRQRVVRSFFHISPVGQPICSHTLAKPAGVLMAASRWT